jgi:YD repeat-containing protein
MATFFIEDAIKADYHSCILLIDPLENQGALMHPRTAYHPARKMLVALMAIVGLVWGLGACNRKADDSNARSSALTDAAKSPAAGNFGDSERALKRSRVAGSPATADTPSQLTWQRHFDDQDRLSTIVDPAGRETRFEYSTGVKPSLRITKTRAEGSQVVWEFDEQGRLVSMIDDAGRIDYDYDDLSRLNHLRRNGSPTLTYTYDTLDRVTAFRVGNFEAPHRLQPLWHDA